jgi:hypothetical protein
MEGGAVGVDEVDEGALLGHQCGGMRSHTGGDDLLVPFSFGFIPVYRSALFAFFLLMFMSFVLYVMWLATVYD